MSTRSAPFDSSGLGIVSDDNAENKTKNKMLFSELLGSIKQFRDDRLPPPHLEQVRDLPIYQGNMATVKAYHDEWQPLISRAKCFYPSAYLPPDNLPFPASLEIPLFMYHVERVSLNKTQAKESKSFGSVGALIDKCGDFPESHLDRLNEAAENDPTGELRFVAHRSFVDLRAYVFCLDNNGLKLPPQRIRFYRTGLILQTTPDFKVIDQRQAPRKRRNDAYTDPIAYNDTWKVFLKKS